MKKVLHITGCFAYGGVEKMVTEWIKGFDKENYKCDLVHLGVRNQHARQQEKELLALGCRIYPMELRIRQVFKRIVFIKNILIDIKYDIVHVHATSPFDVIYLIIAKRCGVNVRIIHSHSTNSYLSSFIKKSLAFFSRCLIPRYATHLLACSKEAGYYLFGNGQYTHNNLLVIHNGIDSFNFKFDKFKRDQMRKKMGLAPKHVFGHVGRFSLGKNQRFIIDVFKNIKKINSEVALILIGDGELKEECMQKAADLGLAQDILFLGNQDNVADYLQAMDTFIFPSIWEGFGVVLIETQCSGLPCLGSEAIVDEAIVTDYVIKYNLENPADAWAKKALELINDDHTRKNAYLQIEKHCLSIKDNVIVLQNIYSQN